MHPILDRENPQSLSTLMGNQKFDECVKTMLQKFPDLLGPPERELRKKIRELTGYPDADDNMIRMKFWFEHDVAMSENRRMMVSNICAGVMGQQYFWDYCSKPGKLAWMLCPITGYQQQLDEAVGSGLNKLRDILELPVVDPITGKANTALITAQTKIIAMLDMRKNGAYTQTINQRSVQVHASASEVAKEIQNLSMEEVEKRMKRLEAQERASFRIEERSKRPAYTVPAEPGEES